MILLHTFPNSTDLTLITKTLWHHKVPHRVRFLDAQQQLWLQDDTQYVQAQALIQQVVQGVVEPQPSLGAGALSTVFTTMGSKIFARAFFKLTPVTYLVFCLMLLVVLITQLGRDLQVVSWFSFFPIVVNVQAYLVPGFDHLWQQPFRLISPMLLHFGWLHLVFNGLWWLDLGKRIERESKLVLVSLLVVTSLAANVAQAWQETSLFGGMSGVIYGLLGYIWVMDQYNVPRYHLPQSILIFMLLWLLLGLSGLFLYLGFGNIANMAHIGGLIAGVVWGFLHTYLRRIRSSKQ
jgi:GlpG protein